VTWLTWRQFRAQASVALATLAVIAITFAITGPHLAHLYAASGIATCQAHGDCSTLASNFLNQVKASATYPALFALGIGVLYVVPAIIAIFWGAPLVARELEAGTFRLVWNQSVTRTRWLAVKIGLIGLASMATAGLFSLMVTWWASPIDRAAGLGAVLDSNRLMPQLSGARGITSIGYAAFAFAFGVTAGVLVRRTLPAMAITLAVFAAVQITMPLWVRPHLIAPLHHTTALNTATLDQLTVWRNGSQMTVIGHANMPGAWILSNQSITQAGHVFTGPATQACVSQTASQRACNASIARLHLRQLVTYQPASRYWAFQWYETAIFLALALAMAGFCF